MTVLISGLKIGKKIGAGYFGEVFAGTDEVHGAVAAKLIRRNFPKAESDGEWEQRKVDLLSEAQLLKKARHPNVVEVFHLDTQDDGASVVYVMHLCDGGSLQKNYEAGPMTLRDVRHAATGTSLGLASMHARGMLHRDIKPSNLLIDNKILKIGDFGLVTDKLIAGFGAIAGYNDHLAPEVFCGHPTSVQSDIWALGITLVRLLSGQVLFESEPAPAKVVPNGGYADKLKWLPHIPKRWRRVIRQMIRDDPSERYQTAQEVQNALAGLPIPDWKVDVLPTNIDWRQEKSGRAIYVQWNFADSKAQTWRAWSEPLSGKGNNRTLGGSVVSTTEKKCRRDLDAFFASRL